VPGLVCFGFREYRVPDYDLMLGDLVDNVYVGLPYRSSSSINEASDATTLYERQAHLGIPSKNPFHCIPSSFGICPSDGGGIDCYPRSLTEHDCARRRAGR
jgi:hypothetical protein